VYVEIPTSGVEGTIERRFVVLTDSRISTFARLELRIAAEIRAPVKAIPSALQLGAVPAMDTIERDVRLLVSDAALVDAFESATCPEPFCKVRLRARQPGILTFRCIVSPGLPFGRINSRIAFRFRSADVRNIDVPVTGFVQSDLEVTPRRVFVGVSNSAVRRTHNIRLRSRSGTHFAIVQADAPAGVDFDDPIDKGNRHVEHMLKISFNPPWNSASSSSIVLELSHPDQRTLVIPVCASQADEHPL
jgi:hypothetical protein